MGRSKVELTARERRAGLTLDSHPEWLCFEDVQQLLRLYQGKGYGRKLWNVLVATKKIPSYLDPFSGQIRYRWPEVKSAIENSYKKT